MKKRIFKFGVTLTAAMMVFASMSSLAFADEVDASADEEIVVEAVAEEEAVVDEEAEEAEDADDVVEVDVPLETEEVDVEEALAVMAAEDVATGSAIAIGTISATESDDYYTVTVPFTVDGTAPDQLTFFVYDITGITDGNNTTAYSSSTPVGYINQYDGAISGTYTFKLAKASGYSSDSVIVVKIGGTDVATPDAKSYSLAGVSTAAIGDVNTDGTVNQRDAALVLRYYGGLEDETGLDLSVADAYDDGTGTINQRDAASILRLYGGIIDALPETSN